MLRKVEAIRTRRGVRTLGQGLEARNGFRVHVRVDDPLAVQEDDESIVVASLEDEIRDPRLERELSTQEDRSRALGDRCTELSPPREPERGKSGRPRRRNFLVARFHPASIVIGYDHRFGNRREGNIDLLKQYSEEFQYQLIEIARQDVDDIAVSSTKVRQALGAGEMEKAANLMGHPFTLNGKVVRGAGIGHTLGYPTANIDINSQHKLVPPSGIYAVKVIHNEIRHNGVLYIGDRPSIAQLTNQTIEVHLFDFNQDLYDQHLEVELIERIRPDAKFDNMEALKVQMDKDANAARQILQINEAQEATSAENIL